MNLNGLVSSGVRHFYMEGMYLVRTKTFSVFITFSYTANNILNSLSLAFNLTSCYHHRTISHTVC